MQCGNVLYAPGWQRRRRHNSRHPLYSASGASAVGVVVSNGEGDRSRNRAPPLNMEPTPQNVRFMVVFGAIVSVGAGIMVGEDQGATLGVVTAVISALAFVSYARIFFGKGFWRSLVPSSARVTTSPTTQSDVESSARLELSRHPAAAAAVLVIALIGSAAFLSVRFAAFLAALAVVMLLCLAVLRHIGRSWCGGQTRRHRLQISQACSCAFVIRPERADIEPPSAAVGTLTTQWLDSAL
jgi:hypothetical protein